MHRIIVLRGNGSAIVKETLFWHLIVATIQKIYHIIIYIEYCRQYKKCSRPGSEKNVNEVVSLLSLWRYQAVTSVIGFVKNLNISNCYHDHGLCVDAVCAVFSFNKSSRNNFVNNLLLQSFFA